MDDLDLCLEVVLRSYQPLRLICHWISRKSKGQLWDSIARLYFGNSLASCLFGA